jgi:uncharacterized protein YjiS (DUF1127 family)
MLLSPSSFPTSVRPAPSKRSVASVAQFFEEAVDSLLLWMEERRQRRHLRELDDRLLKDIGLTRADVERETRYRI